MCGIGGIKRFGDMPINKDWPGLLLMSLEKRGNDATGIAIQKADGSVAVLKDATPAWHFVASEAYTSFIDAHLTADAFTVLLHTRLATVGDPEVNANNHPLMLADSVVVHNGCLNNHHLMFTNNPDMPKSCDTDSDIIRAMLDKYGLNARGVKELSRLSGSGAIAVVSQKNPGLLLLGRSGNPLTLAKADNCLVWASEKSCIHAALRPRVSLAGLDFQVQRLDIGFMGMQDNTAYLFDSTRLLWHEELKISYHYTEPIRATHDGYQSRRDKWANSRGDKPKTGTSYTYHQDAVTVIAKKTDSWVECPKCKKEITLLPSGYWVCHPCMINGNIPKELGKGAN